MFSFDWAKRTHKGLRKWVLYIVRDSPKTGVEIMDAMEVNLQGWWRPSPGSIYPLLKNMVQEGVLQRSDDDRYSLTAKGKDEISHHWPLMEGGSPELKSVEGALEVISSYTSYLEDLSRSKDQKLAQGAMQIRELAERLSKLGAGA